MSFLQRDGHDPRPPTTRTLCHIGNHLEEPMRISTTLLFTTLVLAAHPAEGQQTSPTTGGTTAPAPPGAYSAQNVVTVVATVKALDKPTRTITLEGSDGHTVDVVATDEVRNFDQLKVGDHVAIQYQEALELELKKTQGQAAATETGVVSRSK